MAITFSGVNFSGGFQIQPTFAPDAPTVGSATATGSTTATVAFTAPSYGGSTTITTYTATSSPGGVTGTLSQAGSGTITVTGLTASTSYTFTVTATNTNGTSVASSASNSITTQSGIIPIEYLVVGPGGNADPSAGSTPPYAKGGGGGSGGAVFGSVNALGSYTVTVGTSTGPYYQPGTNSSLVGTGFTRTAYAGGNGAPANPNANPQNGYAGYAGAGGAQGDGSTSVGGTGGVAGSYSAGYVGGNGTYSGGGGGGGGGTGWGINGGAGGAGGQRTWTSASWNNIGTTWGTGAAMGTGDVGTQGIVAIQYPDTYPAATSTTGSPSIVVTGGYRVYTWTSSGSITF